MEKQNRQLVVYLSKSLKTDEQELQRVREYLTLRGFILKEYKGGEYNPNLASSADFILVVPYLNSTYESVGKWKTTLGKGQFTEVIQACRYTQPCFIYNGYSDKEILITKCNENFNNHYIINKNDWKSKYGCVYSYVVGRKPMPLYPFITGYKYEVNHIDKRQHILEHPLTPSEAFINTDSKPRYYDLLLLN
jgi:hypothetical protein